MKHGVIFFFALFLSVIFALAVGALAARGPEIFKVNVRDMLLESRKLLRKKMPIDKVGLVAQGVISQNGTVPILFKPLPPLIFEDRSYGNIPTIAVNPAQTFQPILGFGGAFTEAAASVWLQMNQDLQQEILEAYFGKQGMVQPLIINPFPLP